MTAPAAGPSTRAAAELFDLSGRLALVTGARRGIGLAIAGALAAAGADVVGASASMEAKDSDVERLVRSHGREFTGLRADFAAATGVDELVSQVREMERPVEVLVNNAGTISRAPAEHLSDDDWERVLQVNLTSQFRLTREIGRDMLERGSGKVIFTASMLSFQGGVNVAAYTASKSGLAGLVRALANEWASRGVNVNAIAPGYVVTDNTAALRADENRHRAILDRIPAGRWAEPDDVAGAAVFLASAASDYVHGVVLPVDGGWLGR
jgi:2-dehydro-3-deoxy-D-gluconate 5-dehydrogenase